MAKFINSSWKTYMTFLLLGFVLLIIPMWMLIKLASATEKESISNFRKYVFGRLREQDALFFMILAFLVWGMFWIVSGLVLKLFGDPDINEPWGTLVYAFISLSPMILITWIGVINQKKKLHK